jgi:hypothetical protein
MSSLVDLVLASQVRGPTCRTATWLATLSKKDRAEVDEALGHPDLQHAALARAIKVRWLEAPSLDSISRHRKRECACDPR